MQEVERGMDKKSTIQFVIKEITLLDTLLEPWKEKMGNDYQGYKNHVLRMLNFCFYMGEYTEEEKTKLIIAGAFHDIGIWKDDKPNVDYIDPSIEIAKKYLEENNLGHDTDILLMISDHHKISPIKDNTMAEIFRKADLIDFSLGTIKHGIPSDFVMAVKESIPNEGFHKRLIELTIDRVKNYPLKNPFPMMKK